jgi:hypothetical protein
MSAASTVTFRLTDCVAIALLNQSGDYPASVSVNLAQLLDNANTYVEIQDAIIKRGR